MIVDRDSWHMKKCYELYGRDYEPRNLCRHFWRAIWATVLPAAVAFVFVGVLALIGWVIWMIVKNIWFLIPCALGVGVGLARIWLTTWWSNRDKPIKPDTKEKAPGLFSSWVKAKKGRYCPIIEVRDQW